MFVSRLILLERLWNIMVYQRVASRLTYCSLVFIDWLSIEIFTCMYNTLLVQNAVHKSQVIEPEAGAILAHSNYAAVTMCPVMCHTGRAAHIQKNFYFSCTMTLIIGWRWVANTSPWSDFQTPISVLIFYLWFGFPNMLLSIYLFHRDLESRKPFQAKLYDLSAKQKLSDFIFLAKTLLIDLKLFFYMI